MDRCLLNSMIHKNKTKQTKTPTYPSDLLKHHFLHKISGSFFRASLMAQTVKNLTIMQETQVRSLGWGRSPGEGNVNPLQYSCLWNPMNRGVWWAIVCGVAKNWTQYVNRELPDVQAGFRKGRGTSDQIANIRWIMEKARDFQKNIYFCFIDYAKAFDCVNHNQLWTILKEMGIWDHLTCLLRNLYASQEAAVRTGHGTTDWLQIGKGVR